MSEQFEMRVRDGSHWVPSKLNIIRTGTQVLVDADSVYVAIQSDVDLRRNTEIFESQKFLINQARDNDLFNQVGGDLYVYTSMGARHGSYEFAGDISGVSTNDITIGLGANLIQEGLGGAHAMNTMLESAFQMIREYIKDEFLKQQ